MDRMSHRFFYMNEARILDGYLGRVIKTINDDLVLKNSTAFIVTADHGGQTLSHADKKAPLDYTIPFIIWGKPVDKGVDLYTINLDRRKDPFNKRIGYNQRLQPIRNGMLLI